jgi:hypothetical protein
MSLEILLSDAGLVVLIITNSLLLHQGQQWIGCMAYAAPIGLIGAAVIQMVEPGALTVAQLGLVGPRRPRCSWASD